MNETKEKRTSTNSTKYHSIKADESLYLNIKKLADNEHRSLVDQIRHIYETYIKLKK